MNVMRPLCLLLASSVASLFIACGGSGEPPPKSAPSTEAAADAGAAAEGEDLETRKTSFVAECSKDQPGTEDYCGCAWDIARQTYGDEAVRAKGAPSADDLAKIHVKVASGCAEHFPVAMVERAFLAGCTKNKPEMEQYCRCSWTALSKKMSPSELVVERAKGSEKYQAAMRASTKACQRLLPAR